MAFIGPPGLEQCPYLDWKDTQREAHENAGKAYLGPALNKSHQSSKLHAPLQPSMFMSTSMDVLPPVPPCLSLTIPALCPSAGLILSAVPLGPSSPPAFNPCQEQGRVGVAMAGSGGRVERVCIPGRQPQVLKRREKRRSESVHSTKVDCVKPDGDSLVCTLHNIFPNVFASDLTMKTVSITSFSFLAPKF